MTHNDLFGLSPCRGCPGLRSLARFVLRLNRLEGERQPSPAPRWRWLVCATSMAIGAGCVTDSAPESSASATVAAREPAFELMGDAAWPPAYTADPLWSRAASGGDFEQARLARREGASGLIAALSHGGSLGRAALAALPYASDRRAAQGPLCALIARADGPSLRPLLDALLDAVIDAPRTEESLDPDAEARCPGVLEGLARRDFPAPADHDRAAVVLSRLRAR